MRMSVQIIHHAMPKATMHMAHITKKRFIAFCF